MLFELTRDPTFAYDVYYMNGINIHLLRYEGLVKTCLSGVRLYVF